MAGKAAVKGQKAGSAQYDHYLDRRSARAGHEAGWSSHVPPSTARAQMRPRQEKDRRGSVLL